MLLLCHTIFYLTSSSFCLSTARSYVRDDDVHSEHNASETAKTSASQTLVLSEDPKISPETTVLAKSPRALKRKKPRTNNAGKGVVTAENPSTPHLDDVSLLFLALCFLSVQH